MSNSPLKMNNLFRILTFSEYYLYFHKDPRVGI